MTKEYRTDTLENFLSDVLTVPYFKDVLPCSYTPGKSDLLLITGENATGKSFVRRILTAICRKINVEAMPISMEFRTAGGIPTAFVYGSEAQEATGDLSGNSILGAIATSRSRENNHAIIWDEPDIGLSDNYAAGAGLEIREFIEKKPGKLFFAAIMTHRKVLLEQLLPLEPHTFRLGDSLSLKEFLAAPASPKRLQKLRDDSLDLFRRIYKEYKI